jgi:uncharacterized membrane protein
MASIEHNILIDRPVKQVWEYMSNIEENVPKWDRGVLAARIVSSGPVGVGTQIETQRQFFGGVRVGKVEISEWKPLQTVAFQMNLGGAAARQRYKFESIEGRTRLTVLVELAFLGWWKLIAPMLSSMLRRDERDDLANIKRILESTPAGRPA